MICFKFTLNFCCQSTFPPQLSCRVVSSMIIRRRGRISFVLLLTRLFIDNVLLVLYRGIPCCVYNHYLGHNSHLLLHYQKRKRRENRYYCVKIRFRVLTQCMDYDKKIVDCTHRWHFPWWQTACGGVIPVWTSQSLVTSHLEPTASDWCLNRRKTRH